MGRKSKSDKKMICNGSSKDEETAAHASDTIARNLMENGEQNHQLNFPNDRTEVYPEKNPSSKYLGVTYNARAKWRAVRWSKNEKKMIYNGSSYKDEETAARASDILARKLMENGEQNHKLNFPESQTNKRKRSKPEDVDSMQPNQY